MRVFFAAMVLLLAGCASVPPAAAPARPAQVQKVSFGFAGRIAVRYDDKRSSAGVHWQHDVRSDEILLLAPLGQTVARIRRTMQTAGGQLPQPVYTLDAEDRHYVAHDAASLTEKALGWRLPLDCLQYWVLGLPLPGEPFSGKRKTNGEWDVLTEDGWTIHYTRYATQSADSLPLRITLRRAGLQIRLLIDEWQIK